MNVLSTQGPLPPRGRIRYSGVWRLYRVRLRRRWPQELLAIIGIAVGVALLFASQIATTSLSGPVKELNRGIVGSGQLQLVARNPDGIPSSMLKDVLRLPGVQLAAPVVQAQGSLIGPRGARGVSLYGSDPRIIQLRGSLLRGFSAPEAARQETLVVPKRVADAIGVFFGDSARLEINGRSKTVPVAVVDQDQIGGLAKTSIGLAPLAYLQKLADQPGRLSRILVEAKPGQLTAVRDGLNKLAAGRLDVVSAGYETELFNSAAAPTSQATTLFSVLSAMVGFLFALCAMLVTVAGRRALATDLKRAGFRRPQVVKILLVDAVSLGVVACLAGLAFGDLLSRRGFGADIGFLSGAFPVGEDRIVTWSSVAIAVGGGMLAATLGVLGPLRQLIFARRLRLASQAPAKRRLVGPALGGVCLAASVAITALAPGAAVVGLVVLAIALALLLPSILTFAVTALAWASRKTPNGWIPVVELALPQLRGRQWRVRSLAIPMTGAIAIFGSVSLEGSRRNLEDGLARVSLQLNHASDIWVSPRGPGELLATNPFTATQTKALARTPGIDSVSVFRSSFHDIAGHRAWILAPETTRTPPVPASQILEGDGSTTTTRLRQGGWATLSRNLSDALDIGIGDRLMVPGTNPFEVRVAAITNNLGWSSGTIVLNPRDYTRALGSSISAYQVKLAPGTPLALGREHVAQALAPNSPMRVEEATERSLRQQVASQSGLSRLSQIAFLTLVAAMLAIGAAISGLLWQHRRLVSRHKLDGHRTRRMWASLFVEAGTLIVTGCLAGALFALLGQVLCTRGVAAVTGFPVIQGLRLETIGWSVTLVAGVSLLVVAIPGYFVARVRPSLRG